jgi:hypothetical protein
VLYHEASFLIDSILRTIIIFQYGSKNISMGPEYWWCMPVIPAKWEVEVGGSQTEVSPRQKYKKKKKKERKKEI